MDSPLKAYMDDATATLRGDEELRCEAREALRAEVAAHVLPLPDSVEASGGVALSPDLEPADAVASRLGAAYSQRMKHRKLAQSLFLFVFLPVTLVLLVVISWDFINTVRAIRQMPVATADPPFTLSAYPWSTPAERASAARFTFLTNGDPTRATKPGQMRAIWEAQPGNVTYFQNYALFLSREDKSDAKSLQHFEEEMRRGQSLDPGNALYGYLLAGVLVKASTKEESLEKPDPDTKDMWRMTVQDRPMLDRAMAEYLAATRLPRLVTPHGAMLRERLALLPKIDREADFLMRASIVSDELHPEFSCYSRLARTVALYSHLLVKEGKRDDALAYTRSWRPYSCQLTVNTDYNLIGMLVATAVTQLSSKEAVKTLEALGRHDEAQATRADADRIQKPYTDFRAREKPLENLPLEQDPVGRHAGILAGVLLPVTGTDVTSVDELVTDLRVEQTVQEETAAIILAALCLLLFVRAWLLALAARIEAGADSSGRRPFLIMLTGREWLRTLGWGLFTPVAAYLLITRLAGPWLGRDLGGQFFFSLNASEMGVVIILCAILVGVIASAPIRRRWAALGLPVPEAKSELWHALRAVIGCVFWLALAAWAVYLTLPTYEEILFQENRPYWTLWARVLISVVLVLWLLVPALVKRRWLRPDPHAAYRGTLARSLVPVFLVAYALTLALFYPALVTTEVHWVRRDTFRKPPIAGTPIYNAAEYRVTTRLRDATLKAFDEKSDH